jgi:hypothetical protein
LVEFRLLSPPFIFTNRRPAVTHLSPSVVTSHAPIATDYSAAVPAENEAKDDGIPAKNVISIEVYRRLQPVSQLLYPSQCNIVSFPVDEAY